MQSSESHPDTRGVWVETWTIDLLDGDLAAALLFSQLLWWHQPAKDGRAKLDYRRDGSLWLLRPDEDWHDCRLTLRQVRRIKANLVAKGLVEVRRFKLAGAPTSAWRPLFDAIQEAIRPNPELPSEGQFLGSDAKTSVPSDAQGAVPIPYSPLTTTKEPKIIRPPDDERTDAELVTAAFTAFWSAYPRKTAKGEARKAWPRAIKAADGDLLRIVRGVRRYAIDPNLPEPQFIPHPASWLNGERWDDEPLPPRHAKPTTNGAQVQVVDESMNQILARQNGRPSPW